MKLSEFAALLIGKPLPAYQREVLDTLEALPLEKRVLDWDKIRRVEKRSFLRQAETLYRRFKATGVRE